MTDESLVKAVKIAIGKAAMNVSGGDLTPLAQAAIEAYEANQWRGISSAPKDGTYILLGVDDVHYTEENIAVASWDGTEWIYDECSGDAFNNPTHWCPLPSPPKQEV